MATASHTLSDPQAEKLRHIQTIPALVKYLDEELGWPVGVDDWEDAVFDWQPEELNLKSEHQVAIKSIKQLRPLVTGQPWGIFFVDFDKGQLPIVVLRRVLNGLVMKRRVKDSGHQTWLARDLLFVSSFGGTNSREIALAHFTDESDVGDLPTLRVLGWDEADTALELGYIARTLKEKLRWPAHSTTKAEQDAWRAQWSGAFSLKYRQVINDSKTLALVLAGLAKSIRSRVNAVLALESDNGHLRQLQKAFKDNLIADLSDDGFADMFAQTITYGLFTARASRTSGALVADNLADIVPSTNPFLKELLADFLSAAGRDRQKKKRVDFDELGINDVVTTLRDVRMDAVLRSFNAAKPGEDPVIHFYEHFLSAYNKQLKIQRGVFYTPQPVVSYIVRSVHELLQTEFDLPDGLADTTTWGEMVEKNPGLKLPPLTDEPGEKRTISPDEPFVQILDPATGTATFLVEVIDVIHRTLAAKWKQQHLSEAQQRVAWNEYVPRHLLPRLHAFELMMAPYAIAHMKIGLKLAESGYNFGTEVRARIYLTNALERWVKQLPLIGFDALAHEAAAVNEIKRHKRFTVIIGNPPYSGEGMNKGDWIRGLIDTYMYVDGAHLGEKGKKNWLQDDYVKFLRYAQFELETTQLGILGFINNHSFLDNPTFRGMRASLLNSFQRIRVLDLHGSSKKKERSPDKTSDENVFDIQQGV